MIIITAIITTTTTTNAFFSLVRSLLLLSVIVDIPSLISCQHLRTTVIRKYPFSENCTGEDRRAIIKCEDDARHQWSVDDSTYVSCCFSGHFRLSLSYFIFPSTLLVANSAVLSMTHCPAPSKWPTAVILSTPVNWRGSLKRHCVLCATTPPALPLAPFQPGPGGLWCPLSSAALPSAVWCSSLPTLIRTWTAVNRGGFEPSRRARIRLHTLTWPWQKVQFSFSFFKFFSCKYWHWMWYNLMSFPFSPSHIISNLLLFKLCPHKRQCTYLSFHQLPKSTNFRCSRSCLNRWRQPTLVAGRWLRSTTTFSVSCQLSQAQSVSFVCVFHQQRPLCSSLAVKTIAIISITR